ncbi:SDR family NAD(P)-dependent oxidoreductase [Nocardia sp. NBC_00511]|uniref:SDR family NAD(P)-dependent oxidoreductase n=1 Tax=Nocardia sp. NBC_00511 TaxID=2903591 RepID=UPI0030DE3023
MSGNFDAKTVLITGGAGGIAQATARAFAEQGATVVLAGRDGDRLAQVAAELSDAGKIDWVTADVTVDSEVEAMVAEVVRRHGGLDVAFNNAGIFGAAAPVGDLEVNAWRQVMDVNVTGVFLSMKHEIAAMRGNGGGAIVNMASNIGSHGRRPGLAAYAASKAAVSVLTRAAALDHIGDGIRINAVSPGATDAPMSLRPGESREDRDARLAPIIPVGRVGEAAEIAAAVLWLAGGESSFVVGHDLVIDGGATA